nr:MAG TPA: hypothetical protein [Microviridae sp.]
MLFTRRSVQSSRIIKFNLLRPGLCCRAFLCRFCSIRTLPSLRSEPTTRKNSLEIVLLVRFCL